MTNGNTFFDCLPKDWNIAKIGAAFDIKQGKSLSSRKQTGKYLKPFLRTSNVFWGQLDLSHLDEMDFTDDECETLTLEYGDLLVCEGGDIGRTAIWRNEKSECYYQNHLHRLRVKDDKIDTLFIMYWMKVALTQLGVYEGFANKTTIPNLSGSRLREFIIPVPVKKEQQKIATVLFKIQKAIEIQASIIEKMRELKNSTMHHVFTYGLRGEKLKETEVGPIPESWDVVPIGKVYDFTKKPKEIIYSNYGDLPFIAMDLIPIDLPNSDKFKFKKSTEISSGTYVEDGDILLAKITPCFENGKQCIITGLPDGFGIASTEVIPIKEKPGISDKYLLYYYLLKDDVRKLIAGKMEGATGRQRVPVNLLRKFMIPFPLLTEQQEMTELFLTIDQKSDLHTAKKTALQDLFKTMLNKLMTGEIRVKDLDIDVSEVES